MDLSILAVSWEDAAYERGQEMPMACRASVPHHRIEQCIQRRRLPDFVLKRSKSGSRSRGARSSLLVAGRKDAGPCEHGLRLLIRDMFLNPVRCLDQRIEIETG